MSELAHSDISYADVRDSIAVARSHGEKFFEQIVWQVEHETWTVLGYKSWDEMREVEYGDMAVAVPRADRPEFVSRLRARGLTQKQIATTLGASIGAVNSDLNFRNENEGAPPTITNARGQERPTAYQPRQQPDTSLAEQNLREAAALLDGGDPKSLPPFDPATGELLDEEPASTPAPTPKPAPSKPRRKSLPDELSPKAEKVWSNALELAEALNDDRFTANRASISNLLYPRVRHGAVALTNFLAALDPSTATETEEARDRLVADLNHISETFQRLARSL